MTFKLLKEKVNCWGGILYSAKLPSKMKEKLRHAEIRNNLKESFTNKSSL